MSGSGRRRELVFVGAQDFSEKRGCCSLAASNRRGGAQGGSEKMQAESRPARWRAASDSPCCASEPVHPGHGQHMGPSQFCRDVPSRRPKGDDSSFRGVASLMGEPTDIRGSYEGRGGTGGNW